MLYKLHSSIGAVFAGAEFILPERVGPGKMYQRILHVRDVRDEELHPNGTITFYVEGYWELMPATVDADQEVH